MKIGFYLSEGRTTTAYILADMMVRSVREAMPGVEVHQFTDMKGSILYGLDGFVRKAGSNMMRLRLEHYAAPREWMFVDTDAIVHHDLRHVFAGDFDISVVDRSGSMLPGEEGSEFMRRMPYNLGVVFSRCPEFWQSALKRFDEFPDHLRTEIYADQLAVCDTIKDGAFRVQVLPGVPYNLSPMTEAQDVSTASLVHYKGKRKYWMLKKLYNELGLAA